MNIDKKLKNCSAGLKAANISGLENWKIRTNMIHETCQEGSCTLPVNRYNANSNGNFIVLTASELQLLAFGLGQNKECTESYLLELTPYKGLCVVVCLLNGH